MLVPWGREWGWGWRGRGGGGGGESGSGAKVTEAVVGGVVVGGGGGGGLAAAGLARGEREGREGMMPRLLHRLQLGLLRRGRERDEASAKASAKAAKAAKVGKAAAG